MPVRSYEDLTAFERLALIDISYSRLSSYELCPAKYFFSYITREDWVFSAPAALGNVLHSVLEHTVGEEEDTYNLTEMVKLFGHFRDEYDPDRQIEERLVDAGHLMLSEFTDRHEAKDFKHVVAKEMPFAVVLGSAYIRGFIDRVDEIPGGLLISDYKSGVHEIAAKNIHQSLQLGVYVLACAHLFPAVNKFQAQMYYLRSGRQKSHTFTRDDLPAIEARVLDAVNTIIGDGHFHYTANTRICGFCEHATTGACKVGAGRRNRRY